MTLAELKITWEDATLANAYADEIAQSLQDDMLTTDPEAAPDKVANLLLIISKIGGDFDPAARTSYIADQLAKVNSAIAEEKV